MDGSRAPLYPASVARLCASSSSLPPMPFLWKPGSTDSGATPGRATLPFSETTSTFDSITCPTTPAPGTSATRDRAGI